MLTTLFGITTSPSAFEPSIIILLIITNVFSFFLLLNQGVALNAFSPKLVTLLGIDM